MRDHDASEGNILVNPSEISSLLADLEVGRDMDLIRRVEDHLAHRIRLGGAITYINALGDHVIEDRDGIRPFSDGMAFPKPPICAELRIRELCFENGVTAERGAMDDFAEKVTELAGDDVDPDEVEQMLINLGRQDVVDGVEITKLHAAYLEERARTE